MAITCSLLLQAFDASRSKDQMLAILKVLAQIKESGMQENNRIMFFEAADVYGLSYCLDFVASYISCELDIHLFASMFDGKVCKEPFTFSSQGKTNEDLSENCLDSIFEDCSKFLLEKSSLLLHCKAFGLDGNKAGMTFSLGRNERPNPLEFSFPGDAIHILELSSFMYGRTSYCEKEGKFCIGGL